MDKNGEVAQKVIIFKGDDVSYSVSDPYIVELEKLSLEPKLIPVLKFVFTNLEELKLRISSPFMFSGIIFSSPRCVEALEMCGSLSEWTKHKCFCIGSKTANLVRKLGLQPLGENCGNAKALSEFICRDYSYLELPLLLPHGNLSLRTLNDELTHRGIKVEPVEVYCSLPNPKLEDGISEFFKEFSSVDFVIYMSPSAIDASLHLLKKFQDLPLIKFLALGPTTAASLELNGITPSGIAEKPTPQSVATVISSIIASGKKS